MLEIQKTIVNKNGERLVFDDITEFNSSNPFYLTKSGELLGILNSDGIEIVKPSYDSITMTKYGFFIVEKDNLYGLVNPSGQICIRASYDYISNCCINGMVEIKKGEKIGFANINTFFIIEPIYDSATSFEKGFSKVDIEGKYGLINKLGVECIPLYYDYISDCCINEMVEIKKGEKIGFANINTFFIIEPIYDSATSFDEKGVSKVKIDGKYGFINKLGIQFIPLIYDWIYEPYNGVARTKLNNKYGCISYGEFEIFKPEYDEVSGFDGNVVFARKGNLNYCSSKDRKRIFILDTNQGIIHTGTGFTKIPYEWCEEYIQFDCGISVIKQDGKFRCVDANQHPLVTFYNN